MEPHTPGEWTVKKKPGKDKEGLEELRCTVCGTVLETRPIPATGQSAEPTATPKPVVIMATTIELDETAIELTVGDSVMLNVTIEPYNASFDTLRFESSDPSVARVDYRGSVKALYPGITIIRVYSKDSSAEAFCSVLVSAAPQEEKPHTLFSWLRCG